MIFQAKHIQYCCILFILLLGIGVSSCKNSKEVEQENIYSQRKAFKTVFHEANQEKMIGHYEKAIALFERCRILEANNPAVHYALSDLYGKMGDTEKSFSFAKSAYELRPGNKWYALHLADMYYERQEFAKTADLYASFISKEKNIELKFKYTDALILSGQNDLAIDMLNEIEVETGKTPEVTFTKYDLLIEQGNQEAAEKELEAFMEESPGSSDAKIMVAELYLQRNNLIKAEQIVKDVIKNDPKYGQAYIMLADLHLRQNRLNSAFQNLRIGFENNAVEIERKVAILGGLLPFAETGKRDYKVMREKIGILFSIVEETGANNGEFQELYGNYWIMEGDYEKASGAYRNAVKLNPDSFDAWLFLLETQKNNASFEQMQIDGAGAIELFPAQPILYLLTGLAAKENEDFETAEEWLYLGKDLVVKDPPLQSEFLYHLGDMNFRQGNADEGKFYFQQAIDAYEGNIHVYADRAKRLADQGKMDAAITTLKEGLKISPKNTLLNQLHGEYLMQEKKYDAAKSAFLNALTNDSFNGELLEQLGDALFLLGQTNDALEVWKEAMENGNNSPLLQKKLKDKKYYPTE